MKIHFIGIGGIGVSALAQYYLQKGHEVSGSDLAQSEITDALAKQGIKIIIGNNAGNISTDFDLVIYSPAVQANNSEFVAAKTHSIKLQSYPKALGQLTKEYYTVAVAGSHGKSTTTAMTALILIRAGLDPTVIVGTKLKEFGDSNFRAGNSKYLVIEACEYDSSFAQYFPKITVVTNIDKEHLDYFKTFGNVIRAFKSFILKLSADGFLVANKDDRQLQKVINHKFQITNKFKILKYGLKQKESTRLKKILKIPGKHNISNALAALSVARILGVKDSVSFASLAEYKGSWRRFEVREGSIDGNPSTRLKARKITVISDYGHHPTEVLATLQAAREKYNSKKIWCIFQPHQHQRTHYLFLDFVKLFRKIPIDNVIITDIYDVAGREEEKINKNTSSELLVKKIARKNVSYMTLSDAEKFVKENIKSAQVLIIMGAGDIYKLADKF